MSAEVWVVGEDGAMLQALTSLLRARGMAARGFSEPSAALEQILRDPPRVLVTDFAVHALKAIELARALRARLASSCPRLVLLTGSEVRRVDLTLFDHVVRRPFLLDSLLPKIRSYLATRAVRRTGSHVRLRGQGPLGQAGGDP